MDPEYPPLPSLRAIEASLQNVSISNEDAKVEVSSGLGTPDIISNVREKDLTSQPQPSVHSLVHNGDIILEYADVKHSPLESITDSVHRWRVSSETLMQNSPYFRALLDPDKFFEGRHLLRQRELHRLNVDPRDKEDITTPCQDALPTIRMPDNHLPPRLGVDTIDLFLKVLSFNAFNEEEKRDFHAEVKAQKPSAIASLIELADAFNSPGVVRDTLQQSSYTLGKPKIPLTKFNHAMLKFNEDRIRQSIFIAQFLMNRTAAQLFTHTLIVAGSKLWLNGVELPDPSSPQWHHLRDGLEEELYYRRQCILNTITDLQAYFFRAYGALEEPIDPTIQASTPSTPSTASKQYQCRCGLGNSSACDAFHLGQMTRFFTLRAKTIFLGSTLIDPDFTPDIEPEIIESQRKIQRFQPQPLPSQMADILTIISSLKQCPDYQIDNNHPACGIRRRLLPCLDCIEGFVGDERGLLGINTQYWCPDGPTGKDGGPGATKWQRIRGSWANRAHKRALVIDIRLARISGIPVLSPGGAAAEFREEDARLLFTARRRNWEA